MNTSRVLNGNSKARRCRATITRGAAVEPVVHQSVRVTEAIARGARTDLVTYRQRHLNRSEAVNRPTAWPEPRLAFRIHVTGI